MVKDKSILDIVQHLQEKFGKTEVLIKDYWDADLCVIGLTDKTGQYLVYISTWQVTNGNYHVALENPPNDESFPYTPAGNFDNITLEKLEKILLSHFKIN